MSERSGLALAACFAFVFAAHVASAQETQPIIAPAPATPEFMSRYDFHLSIARLMPSADTPAQSIELDEQFKWDAHFGGSFDFADLVVARLGVTVDYQAVMGSEYRPFDPNQGNYTLEGFVSTRIGADTEVAGIFHHVSRHLSDRAKNFAVAYNEVGARLMRRPTFGTATRRRWTSRAAGDSSTPTLDYTWLGEAQLLVRRRSTSTSASSAHGTRTGVRGRPHPGAARHPGRRPLRRAACG